MGRRRNSNEAALKELRLPIIDIETDTYTLVRWLVGVGDEIEIDMDIAELDDGHEKIQLPSPIDGVIVDIHFFNGDTVVVGDVLAMVNEAESTLDSEGGSGR
jgi:pyruvate/2-oxoglutarate dehydrogenase complex dihydrolipoamide acyltransferase (E2) component